MRKFDEMFDEKNVIQRRIIHFDLGDGRRKPAERNASWFRPSFFIRSVERWNDATRRMIATVRKNRGFRRVRRISTRLKNEFVFDETCRDRNGGIFDRRKNEIVHVEESFQITIVGGKMSEDRRVARALLRLFHFDRHGRDRRTIEDLIGITLKHQIRTSDSQDQFDDEGNRGDPSRLEANDFRC